MTPDIPKAKPVLFDAGGTLIHMDRRFFVQTLNAAGVRADMAAFMRADVIAKREISRVMRSTEPGTDSSRWRAYARMLMSELKCEGDALEQVRAALRARHEAGDLWTHIEEGTLETVARLQERGHPMGVVSNADGRVATFLEKAGLARYFDVIIDSGVYGVEKPDPRIFLHACQALQAAPADSVYIGDVYEVDALGARRAGLTPVITAPYADPAWDCTVVQSLTELPELLLNGLPPAGT